MSLNKTHFSLPLILSWHTYTNYGHTNLSFVAAAAVVPSSIVLTAALLAAVSTQGCQSTVDSSIHGGRVPAFLIVFEITCVSMCKCLCT